ncbi:MULTISPECIES: STY4851/ECs_5259 family protein [Acidithiobacillus]|uniref:STY4851/ECs_5259 family protein n=1 Tax=Acidithiobacillus TaxID=119977 RepID=UPI000826934E|nr:MULTISPECIES: STY4851/ECs_5259 family protein [Acidithiobacillus]MDA8175492.1 STY4851/ECs_5259 family protein [Acidithiobacillus sp.]
MNTLTIATNPLKAWLSEFLLVRGLFKGPSAQPLYAYQVTSDEYRTLRELLTLTANKALDPVHGGKWAALFCLFTAEWFRREYDASEGGWSWNGVEDRINVHFNPSQRARLVASGLEGYWQRPIHYRENGRDLLGSLFAEGGLPWLLVQSDTHGFARAVRFGLKHFYETHGNRRSTFDLMTDDLMTEREHSLPQSFRNMETRQLLAGIVEQLMALVTHHPLRNVDDPARYLDEHNPEWRKLFPIPLDEANARGLINDWLKDAGRRRQDRKEKADSLHPFTCTHQLLGDLPEWRIRTSLSLPDKASLELPVSELSTTRLQMAFYEGESLLAKGVVIYGHVKEESVFVRFPKTGMTLERRKPDEPLSLRLLANGHPVQTFYFEDGGLDYNDLPLIFEDRGDERYFVASASCRLEGDVAYVRMLGDYALLDGAEGNPVGVDSQGGSWLEITENVRLGNGDEVISVLLNQSAIDDYRPYLAGHASLHDSLPNTVYMGFPRLEFPEGGVNNPANTRQYANDEPVSAKRLEGFAGVVRYALKDECGETLLRRRFGVLPVGFRVSLFAATTNKPARIVVNSDSLSVHVANGDIESHSTKSSGDTVISIKPLGTEPPTYVSLDVSSGGRAEPVRLRLPYPYHGARLLGSDGLPLSKRDLIPEDLLGKQLVLASDSTREQSFYITTELVAGSDQRLKRLYEIKVGQVPQVIDLFSYQPDMVQLMGAVSSQDAYVKFTVESDHRLLDMNIRRYQGRVHMDGRRRLKVTADRFENEVLEARVVAMLVSDPKQALVSLPEAVSEGVGTGWHEIPAEMERDGPWIVYPAKDSATRFRPHIYVPPAESMVRHDEPVRSLHTAARQFHPNHRPTVINEQVAKMAKDFDHSGWQYLDDLRQNYAHLPLSTFETWLSVSRNKEAVAAVVFRLGTDEEFCDRLRDDLAVIWDCIPISLWVDVKERMRNWLKSKKLSEEVLGAVLESRKAVLQGITSGYECIASYLTHGNASGCVAFPLEALLPGWYQELRRTHESNRYWPTDLGEVLSNWVKQQTLPKEVTNLSSVHFSDAVTYLPIFMAHVTAGKTTIEQLPYSKEYVRFAIKMISEFDRITWYRAVHAATLSFIVSNN